MFCGRQKGAGYHLDLLMIAIQIAICSLLGTPWFVAATVLSINHVRSLTRESESAAPGERPKFLGIRSLEFIMLRLCYEHDVLLSVCDVGGL